MRESKYGFVSIIHCHSHTTCGREVENIVALGLRAILRNEAHLEAPGFGHLKVSGTVLVAKCMTPDHDRLRPPRHQSWNILDQDGLTKHGTIQIITNRAIWRLPHLLQIELFHARLVRSNGGAFDADLALSDGLGAVERHLIISLVTILHS